MKFRFAWMSAVLAAACVSGFTSLAAASSHREAPQISDDPAADNTDTYAWVDANGNLVVIANYIGLELPEGAPNWAKFSDDVLYEIHLARGATSLDDALTYQIRFKTLPYVEADENKMPPEKLPNTKGLEFFAQISGGGAFAQTYSVTKIEKNKATIIGKNLKVPPPNVGPTTNAVANGFMAGETYESHFLETAASTTIGTLNAGEGRVFAGPRDDPFYVDLGAVFDLAQVRPVLGLLGGKSLGGAGAKVCTACTPRDSVRYQNVHTIALEIPGIKANGGVAPVAGAKASQTVGVWASASRRKIKIMHKNSYDEAIGPWEQVSRLGIPLINETVIGLQAKDYWNRTRPGDDAPIFAGYFDNLIAARDAEAVGYYAATAPLAVCKIQNGGPPLTNRLADLVPVINLAYDNMHVGAEAIKSIGDVLRVDLGMKMADFPNGRRLDTTGNGNFETVDVVDTEIKLLFCTLTNAAVNAALGPNTFGVPHLPFGGIPDGVNSNEVNFKSTFPYLAPPWEAFSASPHAAPSD